MTTRDFTFLNRTTYYQDIADKIDHTKLGERVALVTLSLRPDEPLIAAILKALEGAARRGVHVYFAIDAYNFLNAGHGRPGPLWPRTSLPHSLSETYRARLAALDKIAAAGGHCTITNMPDRPFSPIHGGRSHMKACVIGTTVYVGGCNLGEPSQFDVMTRWKSAKAANWVFDAIRSIVEQQGPRQAFGGRDRELQLDASTKLLIDAGRRDQSLILENAYQLIDEAEDHILFTCQYFPGGKTATHLKAAHERGVQVNLIYSHPSVHGTQASLHHLYTLKERSRLPAEFFANRLEKDRPLLHAKVLCTEKGAMVGSHNYVIQGVRYGTAEIALRRDEAEFSQMLGNTILEQITAYR